MKLPQMLAPNFDIIELTPRKADRFGKLLRSGA